MKMTLNRYLRMLQITGFVLLVLLYVIIPMKIWTVTGTPSGAVAGRLMSGPIAFLFWIVVCCFSWRMVERRAKRMKTDKVRLAVWTLLPVVLIGGRAIYRAWPSVRAARILDDAELAPLPASASDIKVYTWSTPFSGEWRLRFRADRADIERFLEASPILKRAEYQEYSEERMRLIDPEPYRDRSADDPNGPDYFRPDWNMPPWYIQEIKGPGRRYETDPWRSGDPGEVIIHTEANLVFVGLSHG